MMIQQAEIEEHSNLIPSCRRNKKRRDDRCMVEIHQQTVMYHTAGIPFDCDDARGDAYVLFIPQFGSSTGPGLLQLGQRLSFLR